VALFNRQDWDALRAMLADDVRLSQSMRPLRSGTAEVGQFFTFYAQYEPVHLVPAWLEGREVVAVFDSQSGSKPSYFMWLEWREGRITFIRDYRYVRYVAESSALVVRKPIVLRWQDDPIASGSALSSRGLPSLNEKSSRRLSQV
jgi:hypothetical protein